MPPFGRDSSSLPAASLPFPLPPPSLSHNERHGALGKPTRAGKATRNYLLGVEGEAGGYVGAVEGWVSGEALLKELDFLRRGGGKKGRVRSRAWFGLRHSKNFPFAGAMRMPPTVPLIVLQFASAQYKGEKNNNSAEKSWLNLNKLQQIVPAGEMPRVDRAWEPESD